MFSLRYRLLSITALSLLTFGCTLLCRVYFYFDINIEWYYALLTIFSVTLFVWEGNHLISRYLQGKHRATRLQPTKLFLFFVAGNILTVSSVALTVYVIGTLLNSQSILQQPNPLKLNLIYGSLINLLYHLLHIIFIYFEEYNLKALEAEVLKKNNSDAQLQLIKNQINPHFLFNNLNVLSGMVIKENPEANHFIEEFSKVYRYILSNQDKELVPLSVELEFLEPYLYLFKKRFEGGLQVEINVPEKYRGLYIVPAALQMLIENAIKHNKVLRNEPLIVRIDALDNERLAITNNLQPRLQAQESSKIGLQNITLRYQILSERTVVVNKLPDKFQVIIPLLQVGHKS